MFKDWVSDENLAQMERWTRHGLSNEQIAKNIKKYRNIAGISQAELAERVGVSHEFIRRNESKKGGYNSFLYLGNDKNPDSAVIYTNHVALAWTK